MVDLSLDNFPKTTLEVVANWILFSQKKLLGIIFVKLHSKSFCKFYKKDKMNFSLFQVKFNTC